MTNDPLPSLLSDHAEESHKTGVGTGGSTTLSSRVLRTSILAAAAVAIALMVILVGNPLALFAAATASPVGRPEPEDSTALSTPIIGPTASALYYLPGEKPTRDEIADVFNSAYQSRTEMRQPPPEAFFKQFQAWAAEADARSPAEHVRPAQDFRAQAVQNARAQVQPAQKNQQVRSEHKIRAKVRPVKNARSKHNVRPVRHEHDAGLQVRPVQNALGDQPVQNAWMQWAERPFGWLYQN